MECLDYVVGIYLFFPKRLDHFIFPQGVYERYCSSISSPMLDMVSFQNPIDSNQCDFNLHFLMTNDAKHLCMCLFGEACVHISVYL